MENITIRKMIKKDVAEISAIYGGIIQKPVHPDFNDLIEQHAQRDEDICLVAELEGQVVGFMISYILTLGFGIEKSAWIATLGVNPEYMGQDIGKKLAMKKWLQIREIPLTDLELQGKLFSRQFQIEQVF